LAVVHVTTLATGMTYSQFTRILAIITFVFLQPGYKKGPCPCMPRRQI